jgi:hypothetical protein
VTLRNEAPASGLPDYVIGNGVPGMPVGTNRTYLSLHSTLDLEGATVDGTPVEMRREQEHGLRVYSTTLTIPPGGQVSLELQLQGGNRFVRVDGSPSYRLDVWHQPTVNPDDVHVTVRTTPGWGLDDARRPFSTTDGTATYRGSPERDLRLTARIDG